MTPHHEHIRTICKLLRSCTYRYDLHALFSDCMEAAAIAMSNAIDLANRDAREKRYLDIVGRYERDVVDVFTKVLAEIVLALEAGPGDVLGVAFAELGLGNAARGQFFTPYPICQLMAGTLGAADQLAGIIEKSEIMRAQDLNNQQQLHVTAIDIDPRAVHMAYIQFTLMHIPAVVIVGNSLSMEMREHWYTPAHILGGWSAKLARRDAEETARQLIDPAPGRDAPVAAPWPDDGTEPRQLRLF